MNSTMISEKEYNAYVKEIDELIVDDPPASSNAGKRLKLLAIAVEHFERNQFSFEQPSPIEAIKFRMEEMGLNQNDLGSYLGGKSRASEILAGKRDLTLPMIKALNRYLKIPLEVLLRDENSETIDLNPSSMEFSKDLVGELSKLGWIKTSASGSSAQRKVVIDHFLQPIGGLGPANVLCRQSAHAHLRNKTDVPALFLWSAKVLIEAEKTSAPSYKRGINTADLLKDVVRLSKFEKGPLLAQELLKSIGIKLAIVPHMSSTYLDGGVVLDKSNSPVIGLTLRYDRLDNFWHTLLHEVVHATKHLEIMSGPFLDDADHTDENDPLEKEADQLSRDAAIPRAVWKSSNILEQRNLEAVLELADQLQISPAIVAGRVRYETRNFKIFTDLLKSGTVKKIFGVG